MTAVQIAGCSGAGKSALAGVLSRRGLVSVDADDDPVLARFTDLDGTAVACVPDAPDLAWLARHCWSWDPARLDVLIRAAEPETLYVCGGADNQQDVAGRFTQVFLLEIDELTMLGRLDARRDYHDWGHTGDTREYLRRKLPALQDLLRASGAIVIDARQPLDQVADEILSRTLPLPTPASCPDTTQPRTRTSMATTSGQTEGSRSSLARVCTLVGAMTTSPRLTGLLPARCLGCCPS